MSKEILNLEPKMLWKHFYSLTQVPRPSKKEEKIREEFLKQLFIMKLNKIYCLASEYSTGVPFTKQKWIL